MVVRVPQHGWFIMENPKHFRKPLRSWLLDPCRNQGAATRSTHNTWADRWQVVSGGHPISGRIREKYGIIWNNMGEYDYIIWYNMGE